MLTGSPIASTRQRRANRAFAANAAIAMAILSALIVLAVPVSPARAEIIIGTNDVLDATGGVFHIPVRTDTSGVLGAWTDLDPRKRVGANRDRVTLSGSQQTGGWVSLYLEFDLTQVQTPQMIDVDSAAIILSLGDLDLMKIHKSRHDFWETMELTFVNDGDDDQEGNPPALTMDSANYGQFFDAGFAATDDEQLNCTVNLLEDLGVGADRLTEAFQNGRFSLRVKLTSHLMQHSGGRATYVNTPETLTGSFQFAQAAVPEPATMAMLAIGALGILRRKRR